MEHAQINLSLMLLTYRILPLEKRDHEHPPTTVPRARPSIASSNVLSADDLFGDPIPLFDSVGAYNRECFQEGISTGKPFGDNRFGSHLSIHVT